MNLGDIIVPLLIIGGAAVQFITKNRLKEPQTHTEEPPKPSTSHTDTDEWKELMDALGHKPGNCTVSPTLPLPVPVKRVAPPAQPPAAQVMAPREPARPSASERPMSKFDEISQREKELEKLVVAQLDDLDRLKNQLKKRGQIPDTARVAPTQTSLDLKSRLLGKSSLRQLIVLNEILAAPVSTRT